MSHIYTSVDQLIGHTPLLELTNIEKEYNLPARLVAKVESCNPAGSVKDRVALSMILAAEAEGKLTRGATIIEPTSGNTGIGLCAVAAAIAKADELAATIPNAIVAGQFVNPANPAAHEATTGPEIWEDTDGQVDIFVCGVGTGGTITGTGRYLKSMNPSVKVIGMEPAGSAVLSGGKAGPHGLQGIGAGFIPEVLDVHIMDEVVTVTEEDAYAAGRLLARKEGILAGISSGAALHAAIAVASRPENAGKTIVVLLPDTGDRYLSTPLFAD